MNYSEYFLDKQYHSLYKAIEPLIVNEPVHTGASVSFQVKDTPDIEPLGWTVDKSHVYSHVNSRLRVELDNFTVTVYRFSR